MVDGVLRSGARRPGRARRPANNTEHAAGRRARARRRARCCATRRPTCCRRSARRLRRLARHDPAGLRRRARPGRQPRQRRRSTASWEPDFFGKLAQDAATPRSSTRSRARPRCRARACSCSPTWRRPTSSCARSTPNARSCARPWRAYADTLRLTERRYQAGDVAELDLARVQAEVAATELAGARARPRTRAARARAGRAAGRAADAASRWPPADWAGALPGVPAGVPSTVLARRPDVVGRAARDAGRRGARRRRAARPGSRTSR